MTKPPMRIFSRPTDQGHTFACSRKAIELCFGRDVIEFVSFGRFGRQFKFDGRSSHRPEINGKVVAVLTFCPDKRAHLGFNEIPESRYIGTGKNSFGDVVLPKLNSWLKSKFEERETASSRHKQIIVEWNEKEHLLHEFEFMLVSN